MITEAQKARFEARQAREQEAISKTDALLAAMVETFDGGGWVIVRDDYARYIEKGNERILILPDLQKRRLKLVGVVGAALPDNAPYHLRGVALSATVSIDRTPATVARDFERRLLPDYRAAFSEQAKRLTEWQAGTSSLDAFAERVAAAAGSTVDAIGRGSGQDYRRISLYTGRMAVGGRVEIGSSNSARFEITVHGARNAERVAALLGELNNASPV